MPVNKGTETEFIETKSVHNMRNKNFIPEPGEKVLIRSRHDSGYMLAGSIIILYGLITPFISGMNHDLLFIGVGVLMALFGLIKWSYFEYIVTNLRFIKLTGYYYVQTEQYILEDVEHVTLWQNFADKLWDRGVVTLHGIGIRTKKVRGIKNASRIKNAIHSQLSVKPDHYFDK